MISTAALPLRAEAPPVYLAAARFFEGEVFVGAQVVYPELVCPGFLGCWFAVEEEHVGFKASPARTALDVKMPVGNRSKV